MRFGPARERVPLRIDPELRAWPKAHARLAMVEPTDSVTNASIAFRAGTVIWVSATGTIPRLPRALAGGATYLVAAAPVEALDDRAFTIAGCAVHRLRGESARTKARAA